VASAPSAVVGVAGDSSVTVSWSAPSSNGGDPVTGYTVTPYIGGSAQAPSVFASSAPTQTISGLTNGTAYTFTVIATTNAGNSAPSSASAAVTPATVASAPSAVVGVAGDSSVTVSWSAPSNDGGDPVTGYTVTPYIGGSAQAPSVFASSATTQTISGLTNGTAYTFTVIATTNAGNSAPSSASAAVTPAAPSSLTIINGNGVLGQAGAGDQIIVVFATPTSPSSFCSAWSSTSYPELTGFGVTVTGDSTAGDDMISSVNDPFDCARGFNFGTIDLGQAGYFGQMGFWNGNVSFSNSTISWNGVNTLTITLGTTNWGGGFWFGPPPQLTPSIAVYTPDPSLGIAGTIDSADEIQF
jgi:hypothetical protein